MLCTRYLEAKKEDDKHTPLGILTRTIICQVQEA